LLRQTLLPIGEVFPAALFVIRAAVFAKASLFLLFALLPAPSSSVSDSPAAPEYAPAFASRGSSFRAQSRLLPAVALLNLAPPHKNLRTRP